MSSRNKGNQQERKLARKLILVNSDWSGQSVYTLNVIDGSFYKILETRPSVSLPQPFRSWAALKKVFCACFRLFTLLRKILFFFVHKNCYFLEFNFKDQA
jgi:hypothetical protein